jgi:acyl-CoA thioesterase-1
MRLRVSRLEFRRLIHAAPRAILVGLLLHLAMAVPGAASAQPLKILALGDSLTAGYGLPDDEGFTGQLGRALKDAGVDARIINGGVSGDTAAGGLARLDWVLADDPAVVIVELGGNDALRGLDPTATKASLDAILTRLQQQHRAILLAGMQAPPNMGTEYAASFNAIYPDLARQHGVTLYPFFLDGVAGNPSLVQPDGIHPTAEGVAIIVRRILPSLQQAIDQARNTD